MSAVSADTRRPAGTASGPARRSALCVSNQFIQTSMISRGIEMYTMHEALARERMRVTHRDAQQLRVARELAAARRWRRLELRASAAGRRARAAGRRHARRAV